MMYASISQYRDLGMNDIHAQSVPGSENVVNVFIAGDVFFTFSVNEAAQLFTQLGNIEAVAKVAAFKS